MKKSIHFQSPPDSGAKIRGERISDRPVCGIEVLVQSCVSLEKWEIQGPGSPFWRLYYPLSDGAEALYKGNRRSLKAGEIYLIPPHSYIDFEAHLPFSKWYFHFTLKGERDFVPAGIYLVEKTERILELMEIHCPAHPFQKEVFSNSGQWSVIELIALVLDNARLEMRAGNQSDERLQRAIVLMNQSLTEKVTLADLCEVTRLKERAVNKLFLQHTGFSPIRYLMELRLNEASRLLKHSTLSIEEVAERSGFANRFYLSRILKKYRNTTPAAFRAQE